ncbi:MAG: hypothetical protein Q9191_003724 [Dirinaria sp. TL-2023a]
MSGVVLKLTSLLVRTLSKPIANRIKAQAREHERFKRICVRFAQSIHRVDMRLRLGLLQDPAVIEKQIAREAAEAQARKHKLDAPTVRTEAEMKAFEAETAEEKKKAREKTKPRIRPLSEAKAIDTGANFVSESFLFLVSLGLIGFEWSRREKKENTRREDVAERIGELEETEKSSRRALVELEREILRLRNAAGEKPDQKRILPKELWELEEKEEREQEQKNRSWLSWLARFASNNDPRPTPAPSATPESSAIHSEAAQRSQQEPPAKGTLQDASSPLNPKAKPVK